LKELETRSQL